MSGGMETFAARLASFDVALPPAKRRTSSAKAAKPITWPHRRPSPAELAHAGFYYKPYETNPDNTMCFLCGRALDGWEEDDNPITEHLKHSPDCGWAIMMDIQQRSSNPAEIEDPTSERIVEARKATFGSSWPHDGKKGWLCQSDKMVEGGWYFCPTEESADLASCAYCKLSLDGWEPQDDPYYEHYRRSSDCSFFVFAQPPGKKTKTSRSKKSRTSKASRLSTQSTATAVSEAPTTALDDMYDQSIVSQPAAKTSKSTKKSSKSKARGGKAKKDDPVEVGSQIDQESNDVQQLEMPKPKQATRGRKRLSNEMSEDEQGREDMDSVQPEPPSKRRATKSRDSVQQSTVNDNAPAEIVIPDEPALKAEPKKSRKGTKKGGTSVRKASRISATSKAPLRSHEPDDVDIEAALSEIDAALEADLKRHASDDSENQVAEANRDQSLRHSLDKSKSRKRSTTASIAPVRAPRESTDNVEDSRPEERLNAHNDPDEVKSEESEMPSSQTKLPKPASKQKGTRNRKSQSEDIPSQSESAARISGHFSTVEGTSPGLEHHDSFVSVEIRVRDPAEESDVEPASKPAPKKASKKKGTGKTKKNVKATKVAAERAESESEEETHGAEFVDERTTSEVQSTVEKSEEDTRPNAEEEVLHHESNRQSGVRRSSKVPPKTVKRYSDIPLEQKGALSIARSSLAHERDAMRDDAVKADKRPSSALSPAAPAQKSTPSPSPQSSDAENHPPSTRPSASRPPVLSPPKPQTVRVPLAASTPSMSPSKRQANTGYLNTLYPWTPVDIEKILFAGTDDKENADLNGILDWAKADLTSPEKKMTVEEWISWNAKNGEERLKRECERLVSLFEKEGGRAMRALEGIECID